MLLVWPVGNDALSKCWCDKDKVGVAPATPAILHSPLMVGTYLPSSVLGFVTIFMVDKRVWAYFAQIST